MSVAIGLLIGLLIDLLAAVPCVPAGAADFHVDLEAGDDARDGLAATVESATRGPVRTIQRVVRAAGPGDTVHLAAGREPYRESLLLSGPSNWMHGAMLTGAESCPPAGWEPWQGRVYRRNDFPQAAALMVADQRVPAASPTLALEPGDWIYFRPYKHLYLRPAATPIGEVQLVPATGEAETVVPSRWGPAGAPGVVRLVAAACRRSRSRSGSSRGSARSRAERFTTTFRKENRLSRCRSNASCGPTACT
jgi:hypothetical protein